MKQNNKRNRYVRVLIHATEILAYDFRQQITCLLSWRSFDFEGCKVQNAVLEHSTIIYFIFDENPI
jgi:hypothetical protein